MILGLYYTTIMREGMKGEGMVFSSIEEVQYALDTGAVHLHAKVVARIPQVDEHGNDVIKRYVWTVRPFRLLPQHCDCFAQSPDRFPAPLPEIVGPVL